MAEYFPMEELKTKSQYLNIKKNGEYRMRFMGCKGDDQLFTDGYEAWEDYVKDNGEQSSRPHRMKKTEGEKLPREFIDKDRNKEPEYFWKVVVWYEGELVVYTIKQKTIMRKIVLYTQDEEDFGDPRGYDLVIKRYEEKGNVKYNVIAKPRKPATQEMLDAVKEARIDLQALFKKDENGITSLSPFGALEGAVNDQENIERIIEEDTADPLAPLQRISDKFNQ
tara:strand:+ start:420 stop:1088 length:669 start_codon:yes stop_codon:yes gene_type:complete